MSEPTPTPALTASEIRTLTQIIVVNRPNGERGIEPLFNKLNAMLLAMDGKDWLGSVPGEDEDDEDAGDKGPRPSISTTPI